MKIQFTPKDFLPPLRIAFTSVATKDVRPILKNVKIDVNKGAATLYATTCDTDFCRYVNVKIEDNGSVLLPKNIIRVLETIPKDEEVTLESIEDRIILYRENASRYDFETDNVEDFPKIKDSYSKSELTINIDDMLTLINRTAFLTQKNNVRFALGNVCFEVSHANKTINAVATNGMQLSWQACTYIDNQECKFTTRYGDTDFNYVLLPYNTLKTLTGILKDKSNTSTCVKMSQVGDTRVRFEYGSTIFYVNTAAGRFPMWRDIIPTIETCLCADFQSDDLQSALKQIKPMFGKDQTIVLNFKPDQMTLVVPDGDKEKTSASLPITCNGIGTVGIVPIPLIELLKYIGGKLHWTMNGSDPIMLTSRDGFRYVAMEKSDKVYNIKIIENTVSEIENA